MPAFVLYFCILPRSSVAWRAMKKRVLVTGASRGIGRAAAREFARAGYDVIAVARDLSRLESLQREILASDSPGSCHIHRADLAHSDQVSALKAELESLGLHPDIVINNAGAGHWRFVHETTTEEARAILDVPFFACVYVTQAFLPRMLERDEGQFINLSTPASLFPWPGATLYAAARWAVTGFTRALRADLAGTGIRVSLLIPGEVSSDYFENHPGAHERLPWISKLLPVLTPEQTARSLLKIAQKGSRRDHFIPGAFACMSVLGRWFPGLFQWVITRSGYTYAKHRKG